MFILGTQYLYLSVRVRYAVSVLVTRGREGLTVTHAEGLVLLVLERGRVDLFPGHQVHYPHVITGGTRDHQPLPQLLHLREEQSRYVLGCTLDVASK